MGISHTEVLVHGIGVLSPGLKVVLVGSELLLEGLDMRRVLEEEDCSVCVLEALELGLGLVLPDLLGDRASGDALAENVRSDIPQTVVLLVQQNNQASRLGVEGARDVQNGGIDKLLDFCVSYGAVLAELVDGAAVLSSLDERVGRHYGLC